MAQPGSGRLFGAALPKTNSGALPGPGSPSPLHHPCLPAHLPPHSIKTRRNLMFSRWKTKPRAGRKCCSRLTPVTAPKSPPFISMWPLQSPQPGKYLPALAWPGPVGGEKNLVLNVTALRARDVSRRQETPGPGSAARPCHGNSPARGEEAGEGLLGSKPWRCLGAGSFPFPELGPSQLVLVLDGVIVTQFVSL